MSFPNHELWCWFTLCPAEKSFNNVLHSGSRSVLLFIHKSICVVGHWCMVRRPGLNSPFSASQRSLIWLYADQCGLHFMHAWTVKLKHEVSARKLSEHVCLKYHVCCHVKDWLKRRCRWERIILIIEHVCFIRCDWKFMTVRASWEGEGRVCVCVGGWRR